MSFTLEQRRAKDAMKKIAELKKEESYGNYQSYAKALPATILMNGLGQAAATLLAQAKGKADDGHRLLYDHLSTWLCRSDNDAPYPDKKHGKAMGLMEAITQHDEDSYLLAQAEAIAYLSWLKKFAVAYLEKGEED